MIPRDIGFHEQLSAARKQLWPVEEKVAILVDGAYVFMACRDRYGRDLDYAVLLREALGKGQLEEALVFTFKHPASQPFYSALRNLGYRVWTKRTKILPDGKRKCNCDGEIITEMLKLAEDGVHRIVLVAGDSDFESPLRYLKEKGKQVAVIGIRDTVAGELKALAPVRYVDKSMLMPCKESHPA